MSRKPDTESFLDYRTRIMDPKSSSFCGAKWHNATIWLGHGQTVSCHLPASHDINVEELKDNPTAIHNTSHKKKMRKMMLEGERPPECYKCWAVEDEGHDRISERVLKTRMFTDEDLDEIPLKKWDDDTFLRTLEISFDKACNFACSYCNPSFSSTWVKDIKDNGPYEHIISDEREHFANAAEWTVSAGRTDEENPYISAFWEWWEAEGGLADTLEGIRITGGEPIMHPSVWKLFDWFKNNPERGKNMRFAINSNLVPDKEKTFQRLLDVIDYVPQFEMFTSCEATGIQAEYIRDGIDYDKWLSNCKRLLEQPKLNRMYIMMTINALCLCSITDFMDDMLDIRVSNAVGPILSLNPVYNPEFQSLSTFPTYILEHYHEKLKAWYDRRGSELVDVEEVHVTRLISLLEKTIRNPHPEELLKKRQGDFKSFYMQYDKRRGKDFVSTFDPIVVDWYNGLTPTRVFNIEANNG